MEVEALNKPTSSSLATTTNTTTSTETAVVVQSTSEKEKELLLDQEEGGVRGAKNQRLRNSLSRQSKPLNGKSTVTKSTPLTNGHSKKPDPAVVDTSNEDTTVSSASSSKEMTAKTDNENLSTATAGRSVSPTKLAASAELEKKTKNSQTTTRATRKSLQLLNNKTNNCNTESSTGNKNIVNNVITEDENAMDGFVSMSESRNVVESAKTALPSSRADKSTARRSVSNAKAASNTSLIHTLIREENEESETAAVADDDVNMEDQNASCSVNMTLSNNNRANLDEEESTMLDNNSMDVSSQQPLDSNKEGTNDAVGGTIKKARRKKRSSLIVNGQFNQGHVEVNKIFVYKWPMSEAEEEAFKSNLEQIQQNQQQDQQHDSTSQNSMSVSKSAMSLVNSDPLWKIYLTPNQDDLYVLQEQISEYLQIKSFKRKYPDIERRFVDVKEREFLRDFRIVTETMCDLGLNALRLGDVLDLMGDEYPDKYAEFSAHLAEKKRKAVTIAKTNAMQLLAAQNQDEEDSCSNLPPGSVNKKLDPAYAAQKMKDLIRKAVLSASNYNRQLVKEKKEERRTCFDLQTMRVLKPRREIDKVEIVQCTKGPYPVALIHGQYQNYYKRYSSGELKYLPLNTAIYETDMPKKLEYLESKRPKHPQQQQHHQSTNVLRRASTVSSHLTLGGSTVLRSPASSTTPTNHIRHILDPSSASTLSPLVRRPTLDQDSMNTSLSHMKATPIQASSIISTSSAATSASSTSRYSIRITASPASKSSSANPSSNATGILKTCYICNKECNQPAVSAQAAQFSDKNNDILIDCSSCARSAHPLCLELNADLVDWVCIRQYDWQCMDCKKCSQCSKSNDEDKMMFCDRCDRGFHTYCVGVDQVPDGAWLCLKCKQFKERLASINEKINAMKQQQNNNHVISPRVSSTVSGSGGGGGGANNKIRQIMTSTTPVQSRHSESKHASPSYVPEKRGRGRPPGSTNKPKDAYSPKKLKQEFGKPHKINSMMMNGYNQPSPSAYDLMDSNSMMSTGSASTPAMVYNNYGDGSVANSSLENYYSYGQSSSTVYIQPQQQQQTASTAQSTQFLF